MSGFVEHRLPASPVFIDPRLRAYPSSLYQELEKADVDQALFDELMDRYGVEWAFRGPSFLRLSGIGRFRQDEWAVVRWDEAGQVLLRRSVPRFAPVIEREEFRHFRPGRALLQSFVELSGEERARWAEEVDRLAAQSPEVTSAQLGLCLERARSGDLARAAEACGRALDLAERRERHQPGSMLASRVALAVALTQLGDVAARQGSREARALPTRRPSGSLRRRSAPWPGWDASRSRRTRRRRSATSKRPCGWLRDSRRSRGDSRRHRSGSALTDSASPDVSAPAPELPAQPGTRS